MAEMITFANFEFHYDCCDYYHFNGLMQDKYNDNLLKMSTMRNIIQIIVQLFSSVIDPDLSKSMVVKYNEIPLPALFDLFNGGEHSYLRHTWTVHFLAHLRIVDRAKGAYAKAYGSRKFMHLACKVYNSGEK